MGCLGPPHPPPPPQRQPPPTPPPMTGGRAGRQNGSAGTTGYGEVRWHVWLVCGEGGGMTTSASDLDTRIGRLDLPSKVRLLTGASASPGAPEPAIGLREMRLSDGPTGVRGLKFSGGRTV